MRLQEWYKERTDGSEVTPRIELMANILGRQRPEVKRLLDIGCGVGEATSYIADKAGASWVGGVELSERARETAAGRGIEVHAVDMNHERLPYDDGSIDAIICGEVIEHLVDTDHLLQEIKRVLTPDGVCVLSTPNLAAWYNRALLLLGYQPLLSQVSFLYAPGRPSFAPAEGGDHLRMFAARTLVEFVELHGFQVLEVRGVSARDLGHPGGANAFLRLFFQIDQLMTYRPTLACDVVLAMRHPDK